MVSNLPRYALPLFEKERFPFTIELFSTADQAGTDPLWTLRVEKPELVEAPPYLKYWPCWVKVSYANGEVSVIRAPDGHKAEGE